MLDEFDVLQTVIAPLLRNVLRQFVIPHRAGHVWLLGKDAMFAAAVFRTNCLDQLRLKRFESRGVGSR